MSYAEPGSIVADAVRILGPTYLALKYIRRLPYGKQPPDLELDETALRRAQPHRYGTKQAAQRSMKRIVDLMNDAAKSVARNASSGAWEKRAIKASQAIDAYRQQVKKAKASGTASIVELEAMYNSAEEAYALTLLSDDNGLHAAKLANRMAADFNKIIATHKPAAAERTADEGPQTRKAVGNGAESVRRRKPGPRRGDIARYRDDRIAILPEMKALMESEKISRTAAANRLADEGKVAGTGTPVSRAKALVTLYNEFETRGH